MSVTFLHVLMWCLDGPPHTLSYHPHPHTVSARTRPRIIVHYITYAQTVANIDRKGTGLGWVPDVGLFIVDLVLLLVTGNWQQGNRPHHTATKVNDTHRSFTPERKCPTTKKYHFNQNKCDFICSFAPSCGARSHSI